MPATHASTAASANIRKRIERVEALTAKVEAAGGDVTAVRARLAEASAKLENATRARGPGRRATPGRADAEDKRAAFEAAKATGREAVAELKAARRHCRESRTC